MTRNPNDDADNRGVREQLEIEIDDSLIGDDGVPRRAGFQGFGD